MSVANYDHFVDPAARRLERHRLLAAAAANVACAARRRSIDLAENNLDESKFLDPADPQSLLAYTDGTGKKRLSLVGAPVDWNGDGDTADSMIPGPQHRHQRDATTHLPTRCTRPAPSKPPADPDATAG